MSRYTVTRLISLSLGGLLLAAPAALAQDGGGLRPIDPVQDPLEPGGSPSDPGGWVGDDGAGPQPGQLGPAPAPAPAPGGQAGDPLAGPSEAELTPEERRRRDRVINRNYERALDTYQDASDPSHSLASLDRRIANNERIITEYRQRIAQAQEERRVLQVEMFNRILYLRQQRERGDITQQMFDDLARQEERQFEQRSRQVNEDLEAWHREVQQAEQRLTELRSRRRMLSATVPRQHRRHAQEQQQAAQQPQVGHGERIVTSMAERLRRLNRFRTHHCLDWVHPREVGVGPSQLPVAAVEEEEDDGGFLWFGGDEDEDEDEDEE